MKFTLSWLKKFLDTDANLSQIADRLTMLGLEVEEIEDYNYLNNFELAKIVKAEKHSNADKLKICQVKTSNQEIFEIVCGAPNARTGINVVLAKIGTIIPNGNFKIKKTKIRGVESSGMMCSSDELSIGNESDGIIEISDADLRDSVISSLRLDDPMIHVNVTPNRSDALGVYGIARDLAASGLGILRELESIKIKEEFKSSIKHSIQTDACGFFAIREIKDVVNCESPEWMKTLLKRIRINSFSAIVDISNYIMYSFGQPMHIYDAEKIDKILVADKLNQDEDFTALNDKSYQIKNGDIVIRDNSRIQALAGIIGSYYSSCSDSTKRIVIEVANFNRTNIAYTGRNLSIDTDSRYRFERGVDKEFAIEALDFATDLILSICGGVASDSEVISSNKVIEAIKFPYDFFFKKTGLEIEQGKIEEILEKLGFKYIVKDKYMEVIAPSWRQDVRIKEDVAEEILRIYGYDKLPTTLLPKRRISKIIPKEQKRISDAKRILASRGFSEVISYSFMNSKKASLFADFREDLRLLNPISSDMDYMRPTIIPNLLDVIHKNIKRSFDSISVFEVGSVFLDQNNNYASGIRYGLSIPRNIHSDVKNFDVYDVKADLFDIIGNGIISKCKILSRAPKYYHPTRSAQIILGKDALGYFGEIHPKILEIFNINKRVVAFELNLSSLPYPRQKYGRKDILTLSNYQMITRDFAFIIDKKKAIGDIITSIRNIDRSLIRSVNLFDIYQSSEDIGVDKQSVALSINIQHKDRTLSESDIENLSKKIIDHTCNKFSAILRNV